MAESEAVARNRESAEVGHERSVERNAGTEGVTGQAPTPRYEVESEAPAPPVSVPAQMRQTMEERALNSGTLNWSGGNHVVTHQTESGPLLGLTSAPDCSGGASGVDAIVNYRWR